jgi:hypothetical protein
LTQNFLYFQRNQYFHYFPMSQWNPMTPYFPMNQNFLLVQVIPSYHPDRNYQNFPYYLMNQNFLLNRWSRNFLCYQSYQMNHYYQKIRFVQKFLMTLLVRANPSHHLFQMNLSFLNFRLNPMNQSYQ